MSVDRPFTGQTVLLTGAGGFIGSALALFLARQPLHLLILLEASEQNLFQIRAQLQSEFPAVAVEAVLGSVDDGALLDEIFARFLPKLVIHAAAHKHVELLELNPLAAVRTNILGTYELVRRAAESGGSFLLVSTDKAVYPQSIMGVTKRTAELMVVSHSDNNHKMNAVRLGNVTGSTGSVIPIFAKQLQQQRRLTITHPDATRYFLSVEAAVQAIWAAACSGCAGKILLPEMGLPVSIATLAQRMLDGSNLTTEIIGLRPGEKLTEELVGPSESVCEDRTADGLRVLHTDPLPLDRMKAWMTDIGKAVDHRSLKDLLPILLAIVPEYQPSDLILTSVNMALSDRH